MLQDAMMTVPAACGRATGPDVVARGCVQAHDDVRFVGVGVINRRPACSVPVLEKAHWIERIGSPSPNVVGTDRGHGCEGTLVRCRRLLPRLAVPVRSVG